LSKIKGRRRNWGTDSVAGIYKISV